MHGIGEGKHFAFGFCVPLNRTRARHHTPNSIDRLIHTFIPILGQALRRPGGFIWARLHIVAYEEAASTTRFFLPPNPQILFHPPHRTVVIMVDETESTTTTTAAPADARSDAAAPADAGSSGDSAAKKKRGADSSWRGSKDEGSSDEEEGSDEGGQGSGTGEFQRADAETLSKRRCVFVYLFGLECVWRSWGG